MERISAEEVAVCPAEGIGPVEGNDCPDAWPSESAGLLQALCM